jgi:hypothetical protein
MAAPPARSCGMGAECQLGGAGCELGVPVQIVELTNDESFMVQVRALTVTQKMLPPLSCRPLRAT